MKQFRIGIDNYGLSPLSLSPMEILRWAKEHGAEGVHFSGLDRDQHKLVDTSYLKDLSQYASSHHMYLEWGGGQHIPYDTETWEGSDIFTINLRAAKEAELLGTPIIRSCSGGLFRWREESPSTEKLLSETAKALRKNRSMLRDHNVILAIETHFEFTTFELVELFDRCDAEPGDYLGICLDTMNLLTMLEDPVAATERVLPWVVCTHIKDGGLLLSGEGIVTFPMAIGRGVIHLSEIASMLSTLSRDVTLSIESHGGSFSLPVFDANFLSKFPDLSAQEFALLIQKAHLFEKDCGTRPPDITDREKWPEICESRISQDIKTAKKILN
jgi:sugar phosphate isomerase/epimerase